MTTLTELATIVEGLGETIDYEMFISQKCFGENKNSWGKIITLDGSVGVELSLTAGP